MHESAPLLIVGAGVSGVTTALLLEAAGYRTRVVATQRADRPTRTIPEFASLYPAASIIPHSVTVKQLPWHMRTTLDFFEMLRRRSAPGVRLQPHFEVAEEPQEVPEYAPMMPDFQHLSQSGANNSSIPRRPGVNHVFGWKFQTYFADIPVYLPWLFERYESIGGKVEERTIRGDDFGSSEAPAIINCTGRWAVELVDDDAPYSVLRGHILKLYPPQEIGFLPERAVSYNYIPAPGEFSQEGYQGDARSEVYCYPRSTSWVLGGTRQTGRTAIGDPWSGDDVAEPAVEIDGVRIPRLMLELNETLIRQMMGVDVSAWRRTTHIGYRFARDLDGKGVRLDVSHEQGTPVIHNYGHGGAGVALSWSSAVRVLQLLRSELGLSPSSSRGDGDNDSTLAALRRCALDRTEMPR